VVPFLVEDELLGLGPTFSKVKDGQLITGPSPASSRSTAKLLIETMTAK
jgi:putative intracellular protease/amidase